MRILLLRSDTPLLDGAIFAIGFLVVIFAIPVGSYLWRFKVKPHSKAIGDFFTTLLLALIVIAFLAGFLFNHK